MHLHPVHDSAPVASPAATSAFLPSQKDAPPPLRPADRLIIDLDGTLVCGGKAIRGAAELTRRLADRFIIVSNNSRDRASQMSARLARLGVAAPPDRIVLAGEEAIRFAAKRYPGARCLIVASGGLRRFAFSLGLIPVQSDAEVVILGRDTDFNYEKLARSVNEVRAGATLIAANPDLTHPDLDGRVTPETGALLAAVTGAAGVQPSHVIGKPEPLLFEIALERLGVPARDAIVIGDNPLTDALGAQRAGLRAILVDHVREDRAGLGDLLLRWGV